ncbi:MAG TPA: RNA polymerase sigma factor [Terriglobia bacterium]|jgi:RNA polymerase sigma-70 factor (ECF subfamily)
MAIKDGDFESLVREHKAMLYRIAFNFFLNARIAEEIVQDVFLQCFENLKNIQSPEHLKAWLRRAATHRCIDLVRSGRARKELPLDELPDVPDQIPESDPLLAERLRRLVASLPEKQRMILILRYAEDMDSDEIGELLDMPAPTVRSHLQRALAILREKAPRALGEEIYGPTRKQPS